MSDISLFDGETIHVSNQVYDINNKKFIFKDNFKDLNLFVEQYEVNNEKYDKINNLSNIQNYNEPTLVIHTLHDCWSHTYIDFMFPFFWTYYNIKNKYNIEKINFFVRKGKILQYKHNQENISNNKYNRQSFQTLIELIPYNNLIFEHLIHENKYIIFKDCYHYILDDKFQRSPWNCIDYYYNRYILKENIKYTDKIILEYLTKFSEHIFKKYNIILKANDEKKNVVIINKKQRRDNTATLITVPNLDYIVNIITNNKNYTYNGIKYFEDLDFKKQIETINDNDIIISVHGGALLHMIHGRNKLYIEYFNDSRTNSMYQRVSSLTNNRLLQLHVNSNKTDIYNILNTLQ